MSNRTIRMMVVLGAFVIVGIFTVQLYWVQKAFSVQDKQFEQSVKIGLAHVSQAVGEKKLSQDSPFVNIEQHASNYYVLKLGGKVDTSLLGQVIKNEFSTSQFQAGAHYALYDSSTQQLLYGDVVSRTNEQAKMNLPVLQKGEYYLGLSFPAVPFRLSGEMYIWLFSTGVMLIFLFFYAYALFVILKQKRLSEVQKDFVNNMTHEFKTPLATISLVADTLLEDAPASLSPFLQIVKQESGKLNAQVDTILLSSKSKASLFELKKESVNLHHLLEETADEVKAAFKKEVQIVYELHAEDKMVLADRVSIHHAVQNLLDNAIKYAGEKALVTISTQNVGNKLLLSVSDNGKGIERQYWKKIFEPFFRIPTGDVHTVRGFGIGLHYVQNIVKSHRWKLSFESELNKGTCFTLHIPV